MAAIVGRLTVVVKNHVHPISKYAKGHRVLKIVSFNIRNFDLLARFLHFLLRFFTSSSLFCPKFCWRAFVSDANIYFAIHFAWQFIYFSFMLNCFCFFFLCICLFFFVCLDIKRCNLSRFVTILCQCSIDGLM